MAEEFQGGVCGGNWWFNSSRNLFGPISPCSSGSVNDFGWLNQDLIIDPKTTSSINSTEHDSAGSATTNWNQDLLHDSARSEQNYSDILQEPVGLNNYLLEQQPSNSTSFPINSASYNLLQTLFDTDSQPDQQSLLNNHATNNNLSSPNNNYQMNSTELLPNLTYKPLLNSPAPANFLPPIQPQFPPSINTAKSNLHHLSTKPKKEEAGDIEKKAGNEPPFKRPRIETPSPLPTFKVRKEKLGDRVTALQQLVSPFGKTDTASVLHEAIEYIKFLHDQVSVLSSPYLKNGSNPLQHQQAGDHNIKHQEGISKDLKSRGLCLVPLSSTFPVATETTSDFWTPTFGGTFR